MGAYETPSGGDVNDDNLTNAVDVQLLINTALGLIENAKCDLNNDGKVDAVDVQLGINAALGI